MTALLTIALVLAAGPALAHGGLADAWTSGSTWTYDPWVVVPLYASGLLHLAGTLRLWRRAGQARGVRHWQVACFWSGWALLALALVSPLHWLGERLFLAHMIEHELIMVVAAPLLAAARPVGALLWALPQSFRRGLGRTARWRPVASVWRTVSDPLAAALLHAVALWAWHMPALYNAVLANPLMHRLQHVSFVLTALLFWWSLLYGRARERGYGAAVLYLFATMLHSAALGILLTLSRSVWYPEQAVFAAQIGLTPLEDQQLAGLVMWVPAGLIYTGAALLFAARWIERAGAASFAGGHHAIPAH
jgi:putative membrane protein